MDRIEHTGNAPETTLTAPLAQGGLSFTVTDGTGYPTGAGGDYFYITLDRGTADEEVVKCESRATNTFTVLTGGRGASGTSDTGHAAGATVEHGYTAQEADDTNAAVVELAAASDAETATWTAYSTSMRSYGGNATPANGTVVARYKKVGRTVHFEWTLLAGSATTWGTGGGGVTNLLPVAASISDPDFSVVVFPSAVVLAAVKAGGGYWWDIYIHGGGTGIQGVPGAGTRYRISGTYEAAA